VAAATRSAKELSFDAAGTASTIGNEPTLMIGVKLALQVIR
jgi:hypothetical protein